MPWYIPSRKRGRMYNQGEIYTKGWLYAPSKNLTAHAQKLITSDIRIKK